MKKSNGTQYVTPEVEMIAFGKYDVITESGDPSNEPETGTPWDPAWS